MEEEIPLQFDYHITVRNPFGGLQLHIVRPLVGESTSDTLDRANRLASSLKDRGGRIESQVRWPHKPLIGSPT